MEEQIVVSKTQYPDSMEFGTPSKGGAWKVYINASDMDDSKQRIDNMVILVQRGQEKDKVLRE